MQSEVILRPMESNCQKLQQHGEIPCSKHRPPSLAKNGSSFRRGPLCCNQRSATTNPRCVWNHSRLQHATASCTMVAYWTHVYVYIYIDPLGLFGFGQIYLKLCKNQRWTWAWSRVSSLRLPWFGETWGPLLKVVNLVHHIFANSSSSHDHHHALVGATAAKNVSRRLFYSTKNLGELWFTNQICSPLQDFLLILRHLLLPLTGPRCTKPPFPPLACHADLFDPFAPWPITVSYMETCW